MGKGKNKVNKEHPEKYVLVTDGSFLGSIVSEIEIRGYTALVADTLEIAKTIYPYCERVIIPGGYDIDPSLYGQEKKLAKTPQFAQRDEIELWIAKEAIKDRKPILGICRGHQMLTVAGEGALYQDISEAKHSTRDHNILGSHWIGILKTSRLFRWTGQRYLSVNSYHHQAASRTGKEWREVAWAMDGIVECIEHKSAPAVGVQFHPEAMTVDPGVFDGFFSMKNNAPIEYKKWEDVQAYVYVDVCVYNKAVTYSKVKTGDQANHMHDYWHDREGWEDRVYGAYSQENHGQPHTTTSTPTSYVPTAMPSRSSVVVPAAPAPVVAPATAGVSQAYDAQHQVVQARVDELFALPEPDTKEKMTLSMAYDLAIQQFPVDVVDQCVTQLVNGSTSSEVVGYVHTFCGLTWKDSEVLVDMLNQQED